MKLLFKRIVFIFILIAISNNSFCQPNWRHGSLTVTENGHFLHYEDGTPFFWLGDTAWELFSRLNKEEIEMYLENRRQKGFNVIQAVILANLNKPLIPNQYDDIPLINNDPEKPNKDYFQLVDWVVQKALEKNMLMGLLPTWGTRVSKLWGTAPIIFNEQSASSYGLFLGKRYKDYPNIIWIMGGDQPAFTDNMDWRPVWRAMIKGIREGTEGKALITYHPWGEHSSSEYWKDDKVLDINMLQSGHARHDVKVWKWIRRDYNLSPAKPVLDGEPNYEDHPVNWKVKDGYFRAYDVRKQIYRSVFAGACGVTYGHHAVWQFYSSSEKPINSPDRYWTEAIDRPGAFQAGYLKKLILSRPSLNRVPDKTIILKGQGKKNADHITAFRNGDNSYAMIYLPVGKKIEVNTSWMEASNMTGWWFNPKTGEAQKIGVFEKESSLWFEPPTVGIGNDWVLVLDEAERKWSPPGILLD